MKLAAQAGRSWQRSPWRGALWFGAAAALVTPAIAMQFVDGMAWGPRDFAAFGVMIAGACVALECAMRTAADVAYRGAMVLAVVTGFVMLWANLAIGIIGDEGHPANLMCHAVFAVGIVGALIAQLKARGMARTLVAMACAQVLVTGVAMLVGRGEAVLACGILAATWLLCAWGFDRAANRAHSAGV